jgi:hypothetical protein
VYFVGARTPREPPCTGCTWFAPDHGRISRTSVHLVEILDAVDELVLDAQLDAAPGIGVEDTDQPRSGSGRKSPKLAGSSHS